MIFAQSNPVGYVVQQHGRPSEGPRRALKVPYPYPHPPQFRAVGDRYERKRRCKDSYKARNDG